MTRHTPSLEFAWLWEPDSLLGLQRWLFVSAWLSSFLSRFHCRSNDDFLPSNTPSSSTERICAKILMVWWSADAKNVRKMRGWRTESREYLTWVQSALIISRVRPEEEVYENKDRMKDKGLTDTKGERMSRWGWVMSIFSYTECCRRDRKEESFGINLNNITIDIIILTDLGSTSS